MAEETDRELLEMAAKAAGEIPQSWCGNPNYLDGVLMRWNPLTNDGDALRLAVKLGISVSTPDDGDQVASATHWSLPLFLAEKSGDDACAATRRAIVRAAAEIGRRMP